jgi:hypothetical protein
MDIGKKAIEVLFSKIKTGIRKHKIEKILIEPKLKCGSLDKITIYRRDL